MWRLLCDDWLLSSIEEKVSGRVMFLTTGKEMWDTLKVMYGNDKNPSRVLRSMKQGEKSVPESYGERRSLIDELEMHHPVVTNAATLRGIVKDFTMSKFMSA